MDTHEFVDHLLTSGRDILGRGQAYLEQSIGLPASGPERDDALSNLSTGAAAAGAAAVLLGTHAGRAVTGSAIKVGGLAAIGSLVYNAYKNWQGASTETASVAASTVNQLHGDEAQTRTRALLRAMIGAAKCDGQIDDEEQEKLDAYMKKLDVDEETSQFVRVEISRPLDVHDIADGSDSPAAAAEIYLASLSMVDTSNENERDFLDDLAQALEIDPELQTELEATLEPA